MGERDRGERERKQALQRARRQPKRHRPSERKRHAWAAMIKRKYGITPEDVARQWELQSGKCPLCGVELERKVWVIDHDHKTDLFRGILDGWCNHRVLSMIERGGRRRALGSIVYLGWANCNAFGLIQADL